MRTTTLLLLALGILAVQGCYYDNEEDLYPNSFCDTTNVTYANTIDPIIQGKCAIPGCHVLHGDGTGDFTNFGQFSQLVASGRVLRSIKHLPNGIAMPPSGALRACEIRKIEIWIAAGALND
jgi:hypothetical protein